MKIFIALSVLIISISACNQQDEQTAYDSILKEAPFDVLTDSINREKNNDALYYRRGLKLKEANYTEPALADFNKAWSLNKREEYAVHISSILLDKKPDSAQVFLESALRIIPSVFFELQLAEAYILQNKNDEALKVYDEILKKEPRQIDALMKRSALLEEKGQSEASLASLEKAYELAPFDVEISYALAYKYAENNNPKAIALSDSLIRMDSSASHAEPYYFKGVYYANTGNKGKALQLFNQAIQHDYNFFDAHMEKGVIYFDEGKLDEAYKTFELVITISPSYANAYYWIGKIQEKQGLLKEAKLNYQRAYGLDKTLTKAKQAADKIR